MHLITKRSLIQSIYQSWLNTYGDGRWGKDKLEIGKRLKQLNLNEATEDDVAAIIGNSLWTKIYCNSCNYSVDTAVVVETDEVTMHICDKCVTEAKNLLSKKKEKK